MKKTFDTLQQEAVWKILEKYGTRMKMIELIKMFYRDYECTVEVGGELWEAFEVRSGVRQGCNISTTLFIVAPDWVMRRVVEGRGKRIRWRMMEQLEDLDFADEICLMSDSQREAQEKLDRMDKYGKMKGLKINKEKTKVMVINSERGMNLKLNGEILERVKEFDYLGSKVTRKKNHHIILKKK